MLDNLFLTYANRPFRSNPKYLKKILFEVLSVSDRVQAYGAIKAVIDQVIDYYSRGDSYSNLDFDETVEQFRRDNPNFWHLTASSFAAVHGYINDSCRKHCGKLDYYCYKVLKHQGKSVNEERLKCIECQQVAFINLLSDLALGKSYWDMARLHTITQEEIDKGIWREANQGKSRTRKRKVLKPGLKVLNGQHGDIHWIMRNAYSCIYSAVQVYPDSIEKTYYVSGEKFFFMPGIDEPYDSLRDCFHDFLRSIIGYSLAEFLLNNDRRKLKRCEECKLFFVSKTVRESKYCSDKCRLAKHNRDYISSGKAKAYKRRGRLEGKYQ